MEQGAQSDQGRYRPAKFVQGVSLVAEHGPQHRVDDGVQSFLGEPLRLLDVVLPAHPTEAEVGAELQGAMQALAKVAPTGLSSLPHATDPMVTAAMRIQARVSSAARPAPSPNRS